MGKTEHFKLQRSARLILGADDINRIHFLGKVMHVSTKILLAFSFSKSGKSNGKQHSFYITRTRGGFKNMPHCFPTDNRDVRYLGCVVI